MNAAGGSTASNPKRSTPLPRAAIPHRDRSPLPPNGLHDAGSALPAPGGRFGSADILAVGTHHKTGTVWMRTVLRKIAGAFDLPFRVAVSEAERGLPYDAPRFAAFSPISEFPRGLWARPDRVIIHMIRDPRDILLSGMRYHLSHVPERDVPESWLHVRRPAYGGLTYQQKLRALPDDSARLRFEMEERHLETVVEMRKWLAQSAGCSGVVEWRYEDVLADASCRLFADALRPFARDRAELVRMRRIFWKNSLFGGLARSADGPSLHIRSGRARQWEAALPSDVLEAYHARYSDDLVALGYEDDRDWLQRLAR